MSIVKALVAARSEMGTLTSDRKATIQGRNGSSFTFRYPTLSNILNVVNPALAKHGVFLMQTVSTANGKVGVTTQLHGEGEELNSGFLEIDTDGSSRDLAGKVTHARRIQLLAMLGLEAVDGDETPVHQQQRNRQAEPVADNYKYKDWKSQEPLRRAAQLGSEVDLAHDDDDLRRRLVACDTDDAANMPTIIAPGKTFSMYGYVCSLVGGGRGEEVLSFLLARAVHRDSPLKASHNWLIDELKEGKHQVAINEVLEHLK